MTDLKEKIEKVLAWTMYSPRRFTLIATPLALLLAWVVFFAPISPGDEETLAAASETPTPTPTVTEAPTAPASTPTAEPPEPAETDTGHTDHTYVTTPADSQAVSQATTVIASFTSIYLNEREHEVWLQKLTPLTHEALLAGYEYTDMRMVPVGTPGPPEVTAASASYVETIVPVDGEVPLLRVAAGDTSDGWKVVSAAPEQ